MHLQIVIQNLHIFHCLKSLIQKATIGCRLCCQRVTIAFKHTQHCVLCVVSSSASQQGCPICVNIFNRHCLIIVVGHDHLYHSSVFILGVLSLLVSCLPISPFSFSVPSSLSLSLPLFLYSRRPSFFKQDSHSITPFGNFVHSVATVAVGNGNNLTFHEVLNVIQLRKTSMPLRCVYVLCRAVVEREIEKSHLYSLHPFTLATYTDAVAYAPRTQ